MSLTLDDIIDEIDSQTNREVWVVDQAGRVIGKVQQASITEGHITLVVGKPTFRAHDLRSDT